MPSLGHSGILQIWVTTDCSAVAILVPEKCCYSPHSWLLLLLGLSPSCPHGPTHTPLCCVGQEPALSCTISMSCVSIRAPYCPSEHSSSCRIPQAGVQWTNLARALFHMQQLPAAHRVTILHPRQEGLLLCPLLREQVCSSLHSLQKGMSTMAG